MVETNLIVFDFETLLMMILTVVMGNYLRVLCFVCNCSLNLIDSVVIDLPEFDVNFGGLNF